MKRSSLALITLDYPPQLGGVARYLSHLARASDGKMDVFVPEMQGATVGEERVERLPFSSRSRWWTFFSLCRDMKKRGYQTLFVSHVFPVGTGAFFASFFGGPSFFVLLHGLDVRLAQRSFLRRLLLRAILYRAKEVLVNSEAIAKEVCATAPRLQPVVLTPGCESLSFPFRQAARVHLGISPGTMLYLTVSRLISRKGIDTFLSVLCQLPESAQYAILGSGPDEARLRDLVRRYQLEGRVLFVPQATDEQRNEWYAAADVFIFLAREEVDDVEGFGMVCLEAAQVGLPVLASSSGGVPETVIDGQTGAVVSPSDHTRILGVCQRWMLDLDLRKTLGEAGKQRVLRDFRWEDRWKRLADLLG